MTASTASPFHSLPRSDSLIALLDHVRRTVDSYPSASNIIKLLEPLVVKLAGDANRCVASDQMRIRISDKRHLVSTLLFNLCYHPESVFQYTALDSTCSTEDCINPRHKTLALQKKKRNAEEWRPTVDMLRRAYPTCLEDLEPAKQPKQVKRRPK